MDFQSLRKEYETDGFDAKDLPTDPMVAFEQWLQVATEQCPGQWFEPNAMALATSSSSGRVGCRWVLLKGVTDRGIQFFTNYDSDKGQQIAENPQAAATFHWPYLGRQVRFEGQIEKTSREVSEAYFHSRPRGAQLGAAASPQSKSVPSRDFLEEQKQTLEQSLGGGESGAPVPLPDNWGGYLLVPQRIEFWQGRLNRLHDRIVFTTNRDGAWTTDRIGP